jgi:hypothetical protein
MRSFISPRLTKYHPVVKTRRMRWAGHLVRMGMRRGVYRILVGKPGEGVYLDGVIDERVILKWIFKNWDGRAWTGLIWLGIGTCVGDS